MKLQPSSIKQVKKKKHISKKRKKSWRKYIDVQDVDDYLEDKRLEERLGVPFKERQDDDLFQIAETPDVPEEKQKTKLSKREALKLKPIKCFEILTAYSAVPDPVKKRNRVRTPEERKHPILKKIEEIRKRKGILKAKEIEAARSREIDAQRRLSKPKRGEFSLDLWNEAGATNNPLGKDGEWLRPATLVHTLKNVGKFKKQIPKKLKEKPLNIPAVEKPHPGISYNPSYEDHQELLQKVAKDELNVIKQEKHLDRVTTKMYSRVTPEARQQEWLREMSQGLPAKEEEEETKENSLEEGSDGEYKAVNPPVRNLKKSTKKRRKMREHMMEELKRKQSVIEKRKIADIYKLKFVQKELDAKEKKLSKLREKREKIKAIKANEPKKLSKTKFEAPALDFNLAEDLSGNLRSIKPEGNLLNDRFKSLQRRSVVEPTAKQKPPKKAKRKRYIKSSHKIDISAV